MDALILLAAVLATYRLATDVAWTDGPGAVYLHLRGWAWRRWGADDWRTKGVQCPVCVGFWAALPVTAAALALSTAPVVPAAWPLWWLAVAGGAAFLSRVR